MRRAALVSVALVLGLGSLLAPGSARLFADADGDGMPNRWERLHGLDPNRANAPGDPDRDKLRNIYEYLLGGHPRQRDTDADGLWDGGEVTKWGSEVDVANTLVGTAVGYQICLVAGTPCGHLPMGGAVIVLRDATGAEVDRALTDESGRFSMTTAPGTYTFEALAPPGFNAPDPSEVVLRELALKAHVTFGHTIRGVIGQARVSPTCPGPQTPFDDCVDPLAGVVIEVRDATGATVASATTDETGRYAFSLDPGDYTLIAHPLEGTSLPSPPGPVEFSITAEDDGPRQIDSDYDSGIR